MPVRISSEDFSQCRSPLLEKYTHRNNTWNKPYLAIFQRNACLSEWEPTLENDIDYHKGNDNKPHTHTSCMNRERSLNTLDFKLIKELALVAA